MTPREKNKHETAYKNDPAYKAAFDAHWNALKYARENDTLPDRGAAKAAAVALYRENPDKVSGDNLDQRVLDARNAATGIWLDEEGPLYVITHAMYADPEYPEHVPPQHVVTIDRGPR